MTGTLLAALPLVHYCVYCVTTLVTAIRFAYGALEPPEADT
jgi:hypothetical protein